MANILNIGTSALLAFQRAMTVTGTNVANINTDGYSRQRVDLATQLPQYSGSGYVGSGVRVTNVRRQYDEFLAGQVRTSQSLVGDLEAFYRYAEQIDSSLADPDIGLNASLQNFFDSVQGLSNDPGSTATREVMLSESQSLVDRFHAIDRQLQEASLRVESDLAQGITEVNRLTQEIARLNTQITSAPGRQAGILPNDLLDKRDQLVSDLSKYLNVATLELDSGGINIYFGKGQPLVLDQGSFDLSLVDSKEIPGRKEVGYAVGAGTLLVTDELNGGELGGLVRVRDQILDPARMQIGLLSQGLSFTFNAQHRQGISLDNQTNLDYFTDITVATAAPRSDNTGTAQFQSTVTNPAALVASDYRLSYSLAGGYELTRLSDNSLIYSGAGLPAAGTLPDGFDISLTAGAIADGDSFMVRPVYGAGSDLGLAITNGRDIAAAGMLRGETPTTNQGTGTISQPVVNGAMAPPNDILPLAQIKLTYDGTLNRFNVSGPAPAGGTNFAYVAGATQTLYGFDIVINGAPQNGDYFIVSGGTSDNRNILALADLQTANTLLADTTGAATASFQETMGNLVADVGSLTHQAVVGRSAQQGLLDINQDALKTVSGVNLDEEASNLVRFQQGYQAAAKVITAAQTVFDSLIAAVR